VLSGQSIAKPLRECKWDTQSVHCRKEAYKRLRLEAAGGGSQTSGAKLGPYYVTAWSTLEGSKTEGKGGGGNQGLRVPYEPQGAPPHKGEEVARGEG